MRFAYNAVHEILLYTTATQIKHVPGGFAERAGIRRKLLPYAHGTGDVSRVSFRV